MYLNFYKKSLRKNILLFIALSAGYCCDAQTITTFAGSGVAGYNGDEQTATATQLWSPGGITVIGGGNVYVADGLNNRIRKITQAGTVSTITGNNEPGYNGDGGPATDGQLNDPEGVAADAQGNLYISDKENNRIRKITPAGIIATFAGNGETGYSGDGGPATAGQLNGPTDITVDNAGSVYFADAGNNCIRKVTTAGKITTIAGTGKAGYSGDGKNATAAQLNAPKGIAVDSSGNVYVADAFNYRIRKITPQGTISTIAGNGTSGYSGDGGMDTAAALNLPTDITVDRSGNLYIADQGNNCIRKITTEGMINTVAGASAGGELKAPLCVALDGGGNLYITEQQNNRIRRITLPPATKIAKNSATKTTAGKAYTPPPLQNPPMINNVNNAGPVRSGYSSPPSAPNHQTHIKNKG